MSEITEAQHPQIHILIRVLVFFGNLVTSQRRNGDTTAQTSLVLNPGPAGFLLRDLLEVGLAVGCPCVLTLWLSIQWFATENMKITLGK